MGLSLNLIHFFLMYGLICILVRFNLHLNGIHTGQSLLAPEKYLLMMETFCFVSHSVART